MASLIARSLSTSFPALFFLTTYSFAFAQNATEKPSVSAESDQMERWYKIYDEIIDSIQFEHRPIIENSKLQEKSNLLRQTILSINNPQWQERHGRVYLWTQDGRPIILSAIMSSLDEKPGVRRVIYEFSSLTQSPVSAANREGRLYWDCTEPGVTWINGLELTLPASTRALRLAQMRAIARGIEAEGEAQRYRLLSTPLYRYPLETLAAVDGALFAYTLGTDPCIFILIEARQDGWHVAFQRSNAKRLTVKQGAHVICSFENCEDRSVFQSRPFYQKYTAERRDSSDPENVLFRAW